MTGIDIIIYAFGVLILLAILLNIRNFLLRFLSHRELMITAAIGTPIHELSHAIFHTLSGHKIHEVKYFSPNPKNNSLGFVRYSYIPKYPHHQIGRTIAAIAPLFGGIACCYAIIRWLLPEGVLVLQYINDFLNSTNSSEFSSFSPLIEFFSHAFSLHTEIAWTIENLVRVLISLYLIIAISLHMTPSLTDLKATIPGFLIILACALSWYYLAPNSFEKFSDLARFYSTQVIGICLLCISLSGIYIFSLIILAFSFKTVRKTI